MKPKVVGGARHQLRGRQQLVWPETEVVDRAANLRGNGGEELGDPRGQPAAARGGIDVVEVVQDDGGRLVDSDRFADQNGIEAGDPAQAPGNRGELGKPLDVAAFLGDLAPLDLLGAEGAGVPGDPDREGAQDQDDLIDVERAEASLGEDRGGSGITRGDLRVVGGVEQRETEALGALQDDALTAVEQLAQERSGRAQVGP